MHHHIPTPAGAYDSWLVALSYAIAVLTSYTTLELANRIAATRGWSRRAWLVCGALVMGFGVWAMHFTGVLGFGLPRPSSYTSPQIVSSLLLAVAGAGAALYVCRKPDLSRRRLWLSGMVMGLGISGMHYLGMVALSADRQISYDPPLVLLSVVFAAGASVGAFWLAFWSRRCPQRTLRWFGLKLASALVLAVAIVGMHHLGMGAVVESETTAALTRDAVADETANIGSLIGMATLVVLCLTLLMALIDRKIATQIATFESLFIHHPDAVYALSLSGAIQNANPAAAALIGHPVAALINVPFAELVRADDRASLDGALRLAQAGLSQHNTLTMVHQQGHEVLVQLTHVPIVVGHEVVGLYGFGHDVTEQTRVRAERQAAQDALEVERASLARRVAERTAELRSANLELARAGRLKDEFLMSVSHELRTPLHAILGLTESLQDEVYGGLLDQQQRALTSLTENGQHLLTLINAILELSSLEAGEVALDFTQIDVWRIAESCLLQIAPTAAQQQIALKRHCQAADSSVLADARLIRQVLINLLSNALKFTPAGGTVGVEVWRDAGAQVQIAVWDTGIGIAPLDQERLFQSFVQVDSSLNRRYGGTGLGLALAARVVALHGGQIAVSSAVNQGSRFTVSLPDQSAQTAGCVKIAPAHA